MSTLRISGIASGLDTETMVRDLMKAERMRLDRFTQNKQVMQWRQEQYNNVNKDFANLIIDLRKEMELTTTTSSGFTLANSTSNLSWVKKAVSSDESIFTATATSSAMSGTHKIKVEKLAEGVNVASKSEVKTLSNETVNSSNTLADLGVIGSGTLQFEIGSGQPVEVTYNATDTISSLVKNINSATTNDSSKTSLGIQASFDNTAGRLFLSTKGTGEAAQIKVTADAGGLLTGNNNIFKLNDIDDNEILTVGTAKKGTNAVIQFDGAENLTYSSNNFTINGIQMNLNAASLSEFTVKVDTDVDGVFNKIKTFVDKYNGLLDKMNGIIEQKRYKEYAPLTQEQKESLSEDEIKKWEEKAQSGLLRNDEFITRTLGTMRSGLYEKVEGIDGKFNILTTIGIATSDWKDKGKLTIDDTKLKNAIAEDVDGVLNLLFKQSSITGSDSSLTAEQKQTKRKESGLITRLFNDIVVGMKDIISKSGTGDNTSLYRNVQSNMLIDFVTNMGSISYLDKDLMNVEKTLMREENNLSRREEAYWKRFTAMEKALQQMNSQSSWIAQQFGGGQ